MNYNIQSKKVRFSMDLAPLASSMLIAGALTLTMSTQAVLAGSGNKIACEKAGPQAPRDITSLEGTNATTFAKAPSHEEMNLCDIHFHRYAEHRASGYTELVGSGEHQGYACNGSTPSTKAGHGEGVGCEGISAGDTVEVHWVFTTCDVKPGPTLGSCFSDTCKDPQLRVEARVFRLTDDCKGDDFGKFSDLSSRVTVPAVAKPVEYLGSTTGSSYKDGTCSPFKVAWNVSSIGTPLELASINQWCGKPKIRSRRTTPMAFGSW